MPASLSSTGDVRPWRDDRPALSFERIIIGCQSVTSHQREVAGFVRAL
jgi:hypothetical protein